MFVSHERSPSKKTFQKPNILRRKPRVTAIRAVPCKPSPVPPPAEAAKEEGVRTSEESGQLPLHRPEHRVQLDVSVNQEVARGSEHAAPVRLDVHPATDVHESLLIDGAALGAPPADVEASLGGPSAQCKLENQAPQKWQIHFLNAADKTKIELFCAESQAPGEERPAAAAAPHDLQDESGSGPGGARRAATAGGAAAACPVRGCGRRFPSRAALARHLREEHAPGDAPHSCAECGRRFFWAVGLRAHGRAHRLARAPLACPWPGCGRAFRQPCRLREHARAHTGDRPYPCRHPGCGWAFRTNSKLLRHQRRHTGERRHRCACGRAFNRREHLRDHQARHRRAAPAAPAAPATPATPATPARDHRCRVTDCSASFASASALRVHSRRAHRAPAAAAPAPAAAAGSPAPALDDGMFVVQPPSGAAGGSARSARTHCTWPLAPPADTPAEEGSPYALRSDLFLPAAARYDDTQHLQPASPAAPQPASPPHAGLGLLDLMQEELMYTDAVDESFHVLLLSEELA